MNPPTEQTFKTLSWASLVEKDPREFSALSRTELINMVLRIQALMIGILQCVIAFVTTSLVVTTATDSSNYRLTFEEIVSNYCKPLDMTKLDESALILLVLYGQDIIRQSPIKPGCRFFIALPDEFILWILLTWITIEELARFDMALLNHMDRRSYLSLLRDTVHSGVLSKNKRFYKFDHDTACFSCIELTTKT